jgi:nucleotide-binding universal stress UspA family protein
MTSISPEVESGRVRPVGAAGGFAVRRVIVGIDDSGPGLAALREAVALARRHQARLIAVRAWALGLPRHGGRRHRHLAHSFVVLYFSGWEQRMAARVLTKNTLGQVLGEVPADLELAIKTPGGDPGVVLAGIARLPGDVLVVGHERHVSARSILHGSVTSYCLRHAACPVVVVPVRELDRAPHAESSGG